MGLAEDMEQVARRTIEWMRKDGASLDEAEICEATTHAFKHSNPGPEALERVRVLVRRLLAEGPA